MNILAQSLNINDDNQQYIDKSLKDNSNLNENILSSLFPLNILVAEDNKFNQKLAKLVFLKLGYSVDIADNGLNVLEKMKDKNYDFVFMDISMPIMDGFETTSLILEQEYDRKPVIVAMTANVMKEVQNKCFNVGMKDFIPKPIKLEEIERVIRQWAGEQLTIDN